MNTVHANFNYCPDNSFVNNQASGNYTVPAGKYAYLTGGGSTGFNISVKAPAGSTVTVTRFGGGSGNHMCSLWINEGDVVSVPSGTGAYAVMEYLK